MPANVEKKNSLWGEKTKPHCCVVLILLLMLRREHNVNSEAAPTGTCKQTNQKDQTALMEKYQTPACGQMDMNQGLFTVEYSSDHSGCCMKKQTKHEQKCCYTDHQQLASSKQRHLHRAPGALQEYLQTTKMSQDTQPVQSRT